MTIWLTSLVKCIATNRSSFTQKRTYVAPIASGELKGCRAQRQQAGQPSGRGAEGAAQRGRAEDRRAGIAVGMAAELAVDGDRLNRGKEVPQTGSVQRQRQAKLVPAQTRHSLRGYATASRLARARSAMAESVEVPSARRAGSKPSDIWPPRAGDRRPRSRVVARSDRQAC